MNIIKSIVKGFGFLTLGTAFGSCVFIVGVSVGFSHAEQEYFSTANQPNFQDGVTSGQTQTNPFLKASLIFERIVQNWAGGEVDVNEIIDNAIFGMMKNLDPHSSYQPPLEAEDLRISISGSFGGVGMEMTKNSVTKQIEVVTPMPNTPAHRAGIKPGDIITHVDGEELPEDPNISDVADKIKGEIDTTVVLTIIRDGEELEIPIVRETIRVSAVKHKMLENNIGYISVSAFINDVSNDVNRAIGDLKTQANNQQSNLKGIILDLRNNPGGLLNEGINMTNAFVDEGSIVSTEGPQRNANQHWYANEITTMVDDDTPIVVLINSGSASASEIVAGALHGLNRATLVGTKSYGKGSVQTVYPLFDGSSLRLTTAHYFVADHIPIHGIGLTPDVLVELPEEYLPLFDDVDPQVRASIDVILNGYNATCTYTVELIEESAEGSYTLNKNCQAD